MRELGIAAVVALGARTLSGMQARSAVLALALATVAALPPPAVAQTSASVSVAPNLARAQPVSVTLVLHYDMQCGYPGPGPIGVTFPAQVRLPSRIARTAVRVDGHAAPAVAVSGRSVRVGLAPPPQIMCDEISEGELTIVFTRAAGLGNPLHAGAYTLAASRGPSTFSARFAIRRA